MSWWTTNTTVLAPSLVSTQERTDPAGGTHRLSRAASAPEALVAAEQHPRVTAADPNRSRTSSSAVSSAPSPVAIERQRELDGAVVVEVADRDADEREALRSIIGMAVASSARARREDRLGLRRSPAAACATASRARSRRSATAARPCGRPAPRPASGA